MGPFDHFTFRVSLGHGEAPVDYWAFGGSVLEADVRGLGVREFDLSHEEPGAAQDHDVVVLDVLEVGEFPERPQQCEVERVFEFGRAQSALDAPHGIFHAQLDLHRDLAVANDVFAPGGTEVELGGLVPARLE